MREWRKLKAEMAERGQEKSDHVLEDRSGVPRTRVVISPPAL